MEAGYPLWMDEKMKKCLFVTLANENYLEQAKQLFSSVYWNAGWKGDYMLLAHEIPEKKLKWFKDKGILIKRCKAIYKNISGMDSITASKLYLFTPEFKKWDVIIYTDSDVIVRAGLDHLCSLSGFWSVLDPNSTIKSQIASVENMKKRGLNEIEARRLVEQLSSDYNLDNPAFSSGFFVFDKETIKEDTFNKLKRTFKKYYKASAFWEMLTFSLVFDHWKELPPVYTLHIQNESNRWFIPPKKIKGIMLHFMTRDKPWILKNYFYKEWKYNLDRADKINLKERPAGKKWSMKQIYGYTRYLEKKHKSNESYFAFDRMLGAAGMRIKRVNPKLYLLLKRNLFYQYFEETLKKSNPLNQVQ